MSSSTTNAAAASQATHDARTEFFRYHGLWSPGVRLFRNIQFRSKAWVITAAFVVPLAVVAVQWFVAQSDAIEFSSKERLGVEYAQQVAPLVPLAQRQRFLTLRAAAGQNDDAALAAVQASLADKFKALEATHTRLGTALGTESAYKDVGSARQGVLASTAGADKVFASHTAFVKSLIALITAAADGSNLTLDPDIDTYYLMDSAYGAIPTLAESVGQLRALAASGSLGANATREVIREASAAEAIGDEFHERMAAGLAKVRAARPELAKVLDAKSATEPMHKMHEIAQSAKPDQAEVQRLATESLAAYDALQVAAAKELDRLLEARISALSIKRSAVAATIGVFLALAGYLFYSFAIVMAGGMAQVRRHIDLIAGGDLTGHPHAWGRDEIGGLLDTMAVMRNQLARTIGAIRGSADQVATASTQLSSGTSDLARRTEETAANLEKSASAMEQMQSAVRSTSDTTKEVAALARTNAEIATRGGEVIAQAVTTMQEIQSSSSKVADIISVIDGIAFQTNILALNAAVEAARAGEQGKGFAVVAGEVRSLAQRSAAAAREIKSLIDSSVIKTESGSAVVQEAGTTMQQIVDSVKRINALLAEVASAAAEQTDGIAHVNATVSELDRATQQNAALVEQASASAQSMNQQAQALATVAARFKVA
jgi:methyl-accepting chemotaxis protein